MIQSRWTIYNSYMFGEYDGSCYNIYIKGRLVAACNSLESFERAAAILSANDPANDGPEIAIINREAQIKAEEFFGIL